MSTPAPVLGKYELLRKLAAGGMAEVYLARAAGPMGFEKQVVVKRILPHLADEENFISMFLSEARLAAQLNHPNVVQVFDFGESQGTWFLVMEYIDGVNLRALFRKAFEASEPLAFPIAAKIISLACEGLGFAHDFIDPQTGQPMNLVHRDVSPDNILIARSGAVKVVDFGIAKAANQTHLTKTGTVKGKFSYMPPEQLSALPLDKRADVFALGVVLHELVTGKKPFDTSNEAAIVRGIMYEPPLRASSVRPDMPEALQAIIDKALAKNRDERYQDCRELQTALEQFIVTAGAPVSQYQLAQVVQRLAPPPPQPQPVPTPTGPNGPPMGAPPTAATVREEAVDLSTSALATPPPSEEVLVLTPKPRRAPQEPPPPPVPSAVLPAPQPFSSSPSGPWPGGGQPPPAQTQGWQVGPPGQAWNGAPPQAPGWPTPAPQQPWPQQPAAPATNFGAVPIHGNQGPPRPAPEPPSSSRTPLFVVLFVAIVGGSAATWFVMTNRPAPAPTVIVAPTPVEPPPAVPPPSEPVAKMPPEPAPTPAVVEPPPAEAPPSEPVAVAPEPLKVEPKKAKPPPRKLNGKKPHEPEPEPVRPAIVAEPPKPTAVENARVEFRVRPFGAVWVDGKFLGETPFAPATMTVGSHQVRIINKDLGREVTKSYDVKSGANVFRFSFDE